jgi:hypothetical protein
MIHARLVFGCLNVVCTSTAFKFLRLACKMGMVCVGLVSECLNICITMTLEEEDRKMWLVAGYHRKRGSTFKLIRCFSGMRSTRVSGSGPEMGYMQSSL